MVKINKFTRAKEIAPKDLRKKILLLGKMREGADSSSDEDDVKPFGLKKRSGPLKSRCRYNVEDIIDSCADWRITNKLYPNPYRLSFSYIEGAGYLIEDSDLREFKIIFKQCNEFIDYFFRNLNKYIEECRCVYRPGPKIYTTPTLTPYEYDGKIGDDFEVSEQSKKLYNFVTSSGICTKCFCKFKVPK